MHLALLKSRRRFLNSLNRWRLKNIGVLGWNSCYWLNSYTIGNSFFRLQSVFKFRNSSSRLLSWLKIKSGSVFIFSGHFYLTLQKRIEIVEIFRWFILHFFHWRLDLSFWLHSRKRLFFESIVRLLHTKTNIFCFFRFSSTNFLNCRLNSYLWWILR